MGNILTGRMVLRVKDSTTSSRSLPFLNMLKRIEGDYKHASLASCPSFIPLLDTYLGKLIEMTV